MRCIRLLLALLLLGGCTAPLSVQHLDLQSSYRRLNRSALSSNEPSETTFNTLRRTGLRQSWDDYPDATIAALRAKVLNGATDFEGLFALAELSYLQGERTGSPADFLAAAVYAYAYLFPETGDAAPDPYDPRFRQAVDIYNLGLTAAFTPPDGGAVQIASGARSLPFGTIDLSVDQQTLRWGGRTLVSFEPTSTVTVSGLQNVYRDPGLGAPLAAMTQQGANPPQGLRVAPKLRVPTNLLLLIDAPRRQLAQSTLHGRLVIHTIFDDQEMRVDGTTVPLQYDRTTAIAMSLAESTAWSSELTGFLDGTVLGRDRTQLAAMEPHKRGRMPVVLIHGTASSPFRWADMVNDLDEDPAISDNFEFWFFTYGTGNPIPYSALQLRQALDDAVRQLGGVAADPALGHMTLIGHSQGGLLAKMLVINSGDRIWDGISRTPFDRVRLTPAARTLVQDALFVHPMPEVQRVIFIATPQHGSFLAGFSVAQWVARLVTLPLSVTKAAGELFSGNSGFVGVDPTQSRIGSIYGMSPNRPFIKALAAIPIAPGVHAHSIIPVQTEGPVEEGNDGVVRYASAHIGGVDSELVVRSGHSTQANPATIEEVRRILLQQLAANPPAASQQDLARTAAR